LNRAFLEQQIHRVTRIPIKALRGCPLSGFTVDDRISWAKELRTQREEDIAYCLLGIVDVSMLLPHFVFPLLLFAAFLSFIVVGNVVLIVWIPREIYWMSVGGKSAVRTWLKDFFSPHYSFKDYWKTIWNNP
jgi:hypothetical protein